MRSFTLHPFLAVLLQFAAVGVTVPSPIARYSSILSRSQLFPILSRSQHCTNAPATVAGTFLPPSSSSSSSSSSPPHLPLHPRTLALTESTTQIWCGLGTRTYIIVRYMHALPSPLVYALLESAYESILDVIDTLGDGVIRQGYYSYKRASSSAAAAGGGAGGGAGAGALELYTQNTNNHQQTWGVLGAAVAALYEFMSSLEHERGGAGGVQFSIYDGGNEVAVGTLGPE